MSRGDDMNMAEQSVTVQDFVDAGRESGVVLDLVAGRKGLGREIQETSVNRPQLALTGFYQHFAHRRIQVIGHAEHDYLASLAVGVANKRLAKLMASHIPCIIVTRNRRVPEALIHLGDRLGVPVFRSSLITGHLVNAATIVMENLKAPKVIMQGNMCEILGMGVLITGEPGIGKSEISLSLIKRGFSLVSDDVTIVRLDSAGALVGSAPSDLRYHMEIRGLGIIHVPSLFGVASVRERQRLDFVIHLLRKEVGPGEGCWQDHGRVEILGTVVPKLTLPVAAGRDLAGIVEVAALDHKLRLLGHDAAKELDDKLVSVMKQQKAGGK